MVTLALPIFAEIPLLNDTVEFQYCFNDLSVHYVRKETIVSEDVWAQEVPEIIDCEVIQNEIKK
jgi:hypothetical protein